MAEAGLDYVVFALADTLRATDSRSALTTSEWVMSSHPPYTYGPTREQRAFGSKTLTYEIPPVCVIYLYLIQLHAATAVPGFTRLVYPRSGNPP